MEGLGGILGERAKLTVRPRNDDHITVWLAKPELKVVCQRIDFDSFEYLCSCLKRTRVVLLDLLGHEPQDNAIPVGLFLRTTKVRMFMNVPVVQLQDQRPIGHELFVLGTTMGTDESEGALKPNAGLLHIGDTDERLREHGFELRTLRVCRLTFDMRGD